MSDHVELDLDGFTALRQSPECQAIISAYAADLAAKATGMAQPVKLHSKGNPVVDPKYHAFRAQTTAHGCVASVSTGTADLNGETGIATAIDNAKHDTLRKALG